jgi:NAD(P)-dependent dehydrogenase (short-subunit alcohol dehydrogenase family)
MGYAGLELNDKVAVVIGGTSGIGKVIACGLAQAGADVIPTSRRAEMVEDAARQIEALGRRSLRVTSDVTNRASLESLLDAVLKACGKVDILVNAAGRTKRTPILQVDEKEWNEIFETNLTGALRAGQVFCRHMVERKYERIIHIACLASFVALREVAAYNASKAAQASLTRTMAVEWARYGTCVNAIAPGVFRTALNKDLLDGTPRGREFLM